MSVFSCSAERDVPVMIDATDEQLAALAAKGDSRAFDELAARYIPLVGLRASAFYDGGSAISGAEDMGQEGFIGFIDAVRRYNSDMGASFRTFAVLCIDRRMKSVIRASLRKKKVPDSALVWLDDEQTPDIVAPSSDNPEQCVIARDDHRALCERIRATASDFENRVLSLFLSGMSYQMIAKKLGSDEKAVGNALQRIRRKLSDRK